MWTHVSSLGLFRFFIQNTFNKRLVDKITPGLLLVINLNITTIYNGFKYCGCLPFSRSGIEAKL